MTIMMDGRIPYLLLDEDQKILRKEMNARIPYLRREEGQIILRKERNARILYLRLERVPTPLWRTYG